VLYLVVNHAFLRVITLDRMRENPTLVANLVAENAFGPSGSIFLRILILISVFGALGGLVMTLPRLYFGAASHYEKRITTGNLPHSFFRVLSVVSKMRSVPSGSILFCAAISILALLSLGSFGKIVNFFVVPLQFVNILMVTAIFRLRRKSLQRSDTYKTPGYPIVPAIFILVMTLFLASAIYYNPKDTLIGIALASTAIPAYRWVRKYELRGENGLRQSEARADASTRL
jgi:amino acid transporter